MALDASSDNNGSPASARRRRMATLFSVLYCLMAAGSLSLWVGHLSHVNGFNNNYLKLMMVPVTSLTGTQPFALGDWLAPPMAAAGCLTLGIVSAGVGAALLYNPSLLRSVLVAPALVTVLKFLSELASGLIGPGKSSDVEFLLIILLVMLVVVHGIPLLCAYYAHPGIPRRRAWLATSAAVLAFTAVDVVQFDKLGLLREQPSPSIQFAPNPSF